MIRGNNNALETAREVSVGKVRAPVGNCFVKIISGADLASHRSTLSELEATGMALGLQLHTAHEK